jgi:predicted nucleic acid-binding protein
MSGPIRVPSKSPAMAALTFVDTNVFVYVRDPRDPEKQARAENWLASLWRDRSGRTSMQVLSEYYYNVTHKLIPRVAPEEAWDDTVTLLKWNPHAVDAALLTRAREIEQRWRLSWWDSMVVAAAQVQGCALLLTEDLQDGAVYGGVTVRSPFTLDVREPAPAYTVAPLPNPRHRGRGRPRKAGAQPPGTEGEMRKAEV